MALDDQESPRNFFKMVYNKTHIIIHGTGIFTYMDG